MALTYEPIGTNTFGSNTASYTFSSISSAYTDLVLVGEGALTGSGASIYCRINGDTGSNYQTQIWTGTASARTARQFSVRSDGFGLGGFEYGYTTERFLFICHINSYAQTSYTKEMLTYWYQANGAVENMANVWNSTAAINSLLIYNTGGHQFVAGTMFTLYGIKAA